MSGGNVNGVTDKVLRMLFCLKRSFEVLTLSIFSSCTSLLSGQVLNMILKHPSRDLKVLGKITAARCEVREKPSACSTWNNFQTVSSFVSHNSTDLYRSHIQVQDNPCYAGVTPGAHLHRTWSRQHRCYTHHHQQTLSVYAVPFWNIQPKNTVNASTEKYLKISISWWSFLFNRAIGGWNVFYGRG